MGIGQRLVGCPRVSDRSTHVGNVHSPVADGPGFPGLKPQGACRVRSRRGLVGRRGRKPIIKNLREFHAGFCEEAHSHDYFKHLIPDRCRRGAGGACRTFGRKFRVRLRAGRTSRGGRLCDRQGRTCRDFFRAGRAASGLLAARKAGNHRHRNQAEQSRPKHGRVLSNWAKWHDILGQAVREHPACDETSIGISGPRECEMAHTEFLERCSRGTHFCLPMPDQR